MSNNQAKNSKEPLLLKTNHFVDSADLLDVAGNNQFYQKLLFAYFLIAQFFMMIIFTSIPFIFYAPSFLCFNSDGTTYYCSEAQACASKKFTIESARVSFITQFELYCEKAYLQTLAKNIIFLVAAGGCFTITMLSDFIGRKPLFLISSLLIVVGCISGLQNNFWLAVAGTTMTFLAQDVFFTFSYLYINEVVGADYRSRFIPAIQLSGAIGTIAASVITLWTNSYWHIFVLNLIVNGALFIMIFYLVETPFILNKQSDKEPLFNALCHINKINNRNDKYQKKENTQTMHSMIWTREEAMLVDTRDIKGNSDSVTMKEKSPSDFKKALYDRKNIMKLVKVCVLFLNIFVVVGLPLVAAQLIGNGNVQLNMALFSIAQMVGFIYSFKRAHLMKRKGLMVKFALLTIIIPLLLIVLNTLTFLSLNVRMYIDLALSVFLGGFAGTTNSMISTYASELFPTAIRGLGIGTGLFVGRSSFIVSNYLAKIAIYFNVNPICFCFIHGILAFICAKSLHETLNKKIKN